MTGQVITLHITTGPRPTQPQPCTNAYTCHCDDCHATRAHLAAHGPKPAKPQPWHARAAA